jgi:hypothetical protein
MFGPAGATDGRLATQLREVFIEPVTQVVERVTKRGRPSRPAAIDDDRAARQAQDELRGIGVVARLVVDGDIERLEVISEGRQACVQEAHFALDDFTHPRRQMPINVIPDVHGEPPSLITQEASLQATNPPMSPA